MWPFSSSKPRQRKLSRRLPPTARLGVRALEDRFLLSAPGTLDTTFGSGGIVTTSFGNSSNDKAAAVAVQPDGKIVVAGVSSSKTGSYLDVVRYNPNGTLDSSFGSGGTVRTAGSSGFGQVALLLQPDGKILLEAAANSNLELLRYNVNGAPDITFNGTGIASTPFPDAVSIVSGLGLESVSGVTEIVAAVVVTVPNNGDAPALARYNLNGSLDPSFGSGGEVVTPLGYDVDFYGLAIQTDGKPVLAGGSTVTGNLMVARYTTSGSLDTTFGNGGVSAALTGWAYAVAVQADGKIVAAGRTASSSGSVSWGLERLNSNGSVDTSFGTGGVVYTPMPGSNIHGLVIQTNGKLVAAGDGNASFALARYNADGSLDTTFGSGGKMTTTINGGGASVAVTLQANGEIMAAGFAPKSAKSSYDEFALARYWGDPVPVIGSFAASQSTPGGPVTLTASHMSDGNPNSTITQVTFYCYDSAGNQIVLGSATAPDSSGNWTLSVTLPPGSYTLYAQAQDNYGVWSEPYANPFTVQ